MLLTTTMPLARATVRVLIVDDQAAFRHAARSVIDLTPGFSVVAEAETGETSIETAGTMHPDLVLMDLNLPGIDGLEATRRMLAHSVARPPVVFLLSTYPPLDYQDAIADCGAAAYLAKAEFGSEALTAAWAAATGST